MPKPILHFAHANGFPSGSYSKIFSLLEDDFNVLHIDMLAHDPEFPVRDGWKEQADQLVDFILKHAEGPVIGVGHSFGASTTFMAALKRPDLFRGIIMLEPIFFIGPMKYLVALSKKIGLVDIVSPAGKTKRRKRAWDNLEEAEAYFKSRALFRNFNPDCLGDYMEHGLLETPDGFKLRYSVEQEVEVFRNGPHHFDKYKGRWTGLPGIVISGEQTDAIPVETVRKFSEQHNFEFQVIAGGHMFPLEQPEMTAKLIIEHAQSIIGLNP